MIAYSCGLSRVVVFPQKLNVSFACPCFAVVPVFEISPQISRGEAIAVDEAP